MGQHSIPQISVDGQEVSAAATAQASTVAEDGSAEITQLLSDMYAQQCNHTDMMVICFGLIIGIMLCGLLRWWR